MTECFGVSGLYVHSFDTEERKNLSIAETVLISNVVSRNISLTQALLLTFALLLYFELGSNHARQNCHLVISIVQFASFRLFP